MFGDTACTFSSIEGTFSEPVCGGVAQQASGRVVEGPGYGATVTSPTPVAGTVESE